MRRIAAIVLLFVFVFNLAGFLFIFKVQQYLIGQEIKQYIKQGVPENQLSLITVTSENEGQLEWEHGKEFRYKDIMYDVVKKEVIDDNTTIYYCITDKQETTLFANLDEQIEEDMETENDGDERLKNLYKLLSITYHPPQKTGADLFTTNTTIAYKYFCHYSSPGFDILSPPPKMI